jgi:hypothetical protein
MGTKKDAIKRELQGGIVTRAFWGAELTGQPHDLAAWEAFLPGPFEPKVEQVVAHGLTRTV